MSIRQFCKDIAYWTMPPGVQNILRQASIQCDVNLRRRRILQRNKNYQNCHSQEERCFILGNGPSVKHQDLIPLRDEIVMSMSRGYYHKNFDKIHPKYHCTPQLTYTEQFTKKHAIEWLQEMHERLDRGTEVFFNYTDEQLIREMDLFPGRKVNFVFFGRGWDQFEKEPKTIPDISKTIPRIQTNSIMSLLIAMYLGFKEIYLLGTDHDGFKTRRYEYPFKLELEHSDYTHKVDGKIICPLWRSLQMYSDKFIQYKFIHDIARKNGILIFNASHGGSLDEFERVDYNSLFLNKVLS